MWSLKMEVMQWKGNSFIDGKLFSFWRHETSGNHPKPKQRKRIEEQMNFERFDLHENGPKGGLSKGKKATVYVSHHFFDD